MVCLPYFGRNKKMKTIQLFLNNPLELGKITDTLRSKDRSMRYPFINGFVICQVSKDIHGPLLLFVSSAMQTPDLRISDQK